MKLLASLTLAGLDGHNINTNPAISVMRCERAPGCYDWYFYNRRQVGKRPRLDAKPRLSSCEGFRTLARKVFPNCDWITDRSDMIPRTPFRAMAAHGRIADFLSQGLPTSLHATQLDNRSMPAAFWTGSPKEAVRSNPHAEI